MIEHRKREPAKDVFRLELPLPFPGLERVNAYLLAGPDGSVLIDCGLQDPNLDDGGWGDLIAALDACDASVDGIETLIVTHPHIDHYGMAARLVEEVDCELWMHEAAGEELEAYREPSRMAQELRDLLRDHGVGPDEVDELAAFEDWRSFVSGVVEPARSLKGGETFEAAGRRWSVVHTPGHSASHVCISSPDEGIFVSGDTLLGSITPHIDFRREGSGNPLGDYLRSLQTIEELAPRLVLPGHGRPFEDGADRARAIARHHERRLGAILQVVRHEPHSAEEITHAVFGNTLLNFQKRLALGEALAHIAYLRLNGELERSRHEDGTYVYKKAARR